MTALEILKKVRAEMKPNAKVGEYDLPVILKAMHEFAALRQPPVIGSVCRCKKCNCEIKNDIGDGLCAECWSAN
jgi:hypothetical protein